MCMKNGCRKIVEEKDLRSGQKQSGLDLSMVLMDFEPGIEAILSKISDHNGKDREYFHVDLKKSDLKPTVSELDNGVKSWSFEDANVLGDKKMNAKEVEYIVVSDSSEVELDNCCRKRKREKFCTTLLNWVTEVAKDPCDSAVESLPEVFKWKHFGSQQVWKQVILARQAMFSKGNMDTSIEQFVWQKQKMHPTMYDDLGSERLRCSQRLLFAKESQHLALKKSNESSSGTNSDSESHLDCSFVDSLISISGNHHRQRVPVGSNFQAVVPEWKGELHKSDSKWMGTQIWPSVGRDLTRHLIERERIGKGRQESCGCQFPGSLECVRFHVAEKSKRLKLELGFIFYVWKFDKMGEVVALSWTKKEETKFQEIVKSNPASMDKCFWDDMYKSFPRKKKRELVGYYYNVFLLRRRGYQNRSTPNNIDSDDDESELASIAHGQEATRSSSSIFCSPKKVHLNIG